MLKNDNQILPKILSYDPFGNMVVEILDCNQFDLFFCHDE